jgi:hypothetical protein
MIDVGKAHQNQKKTAQPKSETKALATRKKSNTINRKQTPIQSSSETHMDLWNSAMGDSLQFQHRNPLDNVQKHNNCINIPPSQTLDLKK